MTIIPPSSGSFRLFVRPSKPQGTPTSSMNSNSIINPSSLSILSRCVSRSPRSTLFRNDGNPWINRRSIGNNNTLFLLLLGCFLLGIIFVFLGGYTYSNVSSFSFSVPSILSPITPGVVRIPNKNSIPSQTVVSTPHPSAVPSRTSTVTHPLNRQSSNRFPYCNGRLSTFDHRTTVPSKTSAGIHIALIGDSVDRLLVLEWCRQYPAQRSLCLGIPDSNPPGGYDRQTTDYCQEFDQRLHNHLHLSRPWIELISPVYCYDRIMNISILMMWNKLGIYGPGPWAYNMTANPPVDYSLTNYQGLERYLGPVISQIPIILGYPPNVLMVQSLYWDLSRLRVHNFSSLLYTRYYPYEWTYNEYLPNVTSFLQVIKDSMEKTWYPVSSFSSSSSSIFPHLLWSGWRTSNFVMDTGERATSTNWRTGANQVIEMVNGMVRQSVKERINFCRVPLDDNEYTNKDTQQSFLSSSSSSLASWWDYVDLQYYPGSTQLRDEHHPIPMVTTGFINQFISQLYKCQQELLRTNRTN